VRRADAVNFNRHTVDVEPDGSEREELSGAHRRHRENCDLAQRCYS
jgi:hypothetical protein